MRVERQTVFLANQRCGTVDEEDVILRQVGERRGAQPQGHGHQLVVEQTLFVHALENRVASSRERQA